MPAAPTTASSPATLTTRAPEAPAGFWRFWHDTLEQSRACWRPPVLAPIECGLRLVEVFDVQFTGFDGQLVHAWLHRPAGGGHKVPVVVQYRGWNCGRGLPHIVSPVVLAGCATLTMDNRGQGSLGGWVGHTPDGGEPIQHGGHLLRGIGSPETLYYRRLITDAVLAVDAARALPGLQADGVAVIGVSQGGGLALAVSGLARGLLAVGADVPFLCAIRQAATLATVLPYSELVDFFATDPTGADRVMENLAFVDAVHFVRRAEAPALISLAERDPVCPPATVRAAFSAYAGPKELQVYPFNEHEGGGPHQEAAQLRWLADLLPAPRRANHPLTDSFTVELEQSS